MKQHHSGRRRILSAASGFFVATSLLIATAASAQTAAAAAPLSPGSSSVQPASISTEFTDWPYSTSQEGWTISNEGGTDSTWGFGYNPYLAPTGSEGRFAVLGSYYTLERGIDASLVSPAVDLTGQENPTIEFLSRSAISANSMYASRNQVELSLDGGQSWSTVWEAGTGFDDRQVTVPIPQAAGHSDVRVRFHFTGASIIWSIDNVFIGSK